MLILATKLILVTAKLDIFIKKKQFQKSFHQLWNF